MNTTRLVWIAVAILALVVAFVGGFSLATVRASRIAYADAYGFAPGTMRAPSSMSFSQTTPFGYNRGGMMQPGYGMMPNNRGGMMQPGYGMMPNNRGGMMQPGYGMMPNNRGGMMPGYDRGDRMMPNFRMPDQSVPNNPRGWRR